MDKIEINDLIKKYKKGDNAALEKLMLLSYKNLYLLSYSYLKDHGLAEDVVSETFVKLIEKIDTIKNEQNLNGYLRTIVINKSLDVIKKRKKELSVEETVMDVSAKGNNAEDNNVRYTLSQLKSTERETLMLWQYGYTVKEISAKTNLTINQVRLLLEKAKKSFFEKYHKNDDVKSF